MNEHARCITGKVIFISRAAAKKGVRAFHGQRMRAYPCTVPGEHHWHLTKDYNNKLHRSQ
jgi:hypothetical protein